MGLIMIKLNLLSIEAWADGEHNWQWNTWSSVENDIYMDKGELTTRKILKYLRKWGYLSTESKGKLTVEDDGYNYVIVNRTTFEPIYALCYGEFNHD